MKTTKRYLVKPEKIHSLKDIELEKQRLRLEIIRTENNIHSGYRRLVDSLTFKNLAGNLVNDLGTTSSVLSKAFAFGKAFMAKKKKHKHGKQEAPGEISEP